MQNEEKYRLLVENIPDVVWTVDQNGSTTFISPRVENVCGYTPEEIYVAGDCFWLDSTNPEDIEQVKAACESLFKSNKMFDIEYRIRGKVGNWIWIHDRALTTYKNGGVIYADGVFTDITERKRAEEEINLLLTITKSIAEAKDCNAALDIVVRTVCKATGWIYGEAWCPSSDGKYLECRLTWHCSSENLEEFSKKSKEFTFPPGIGMLGRVWSSKKPEWKKDATIDGDFPRADIAKESGLKAAMGIPVIAKDKVIAVLNFFVRRQRNEDEHLIGLVSSVATQLGVAIERRQAEDEKAKLKEQLYHSQKLESIGRLAGGVAHYFNNLLTVIIGYGSLLQMETKLDDVSRGFVQKILKTAETAADITRDLLAFGRKQPSNPQLIELNDFLEKAKSLLSEIIREDIKLKAVLTDKDCIVMADSDQIKQVLMNLATNAMDAMPNGGLLTISTDVVELDDAFIKTHGYGEKGMYALISISDTGAGMDAKTKEKIFDPFFTTKDVGRGTGLGLATVYGIVKQHNGYIDIESEPGKGTTFRIFLPLN